MGDVKPEETQEEVVRSETEDGVLKIAEVKKMSNNELRVIVEGSDLERLSGSEARNLAYEQRNAHGMANAGVEALAGTFVPPEEYEDAKAEERNVARWQREFKIVGML